MSKKRKKPTPSAKGTAAKDEEASPTSDVTESATSDESKPAEPDPTPTDAVQPAPNDAEVAEGSPPADASKPPRRWRRRLRVTTWVMLVVIILGRIALPFILPSILDVALESRGLRATYETLDLSILGADLELWHLEIRDRDTDALYLHTEYCRADIAVTELFFGRLVVRRLESDGVDVELRREADGSIPFLARLTTGSSESPEPAQEEVGDPTTIDSLEPPLQLQAMRLQHVHVRVHDAAIEPPFEARFMTNLRLSNVGHPERPALVEFSLDVPGVVDAIRVEGTVDTSPEQLSARLTCALAGFDPNVIRRYLPTVELPEDPRLWTANATLAIDGKRAEDDGWELSASVTKARASAGRIANTTLERAEVRLHLHRGVVSLRSIEVDSSDSLANLPTELGDLQLAGRIHRVRVIATDIQPDIQPDSPAVTTGAPATVAQPAGAHYDITVDYSLPGFAGESRAGGRITVSRVAGGSRVTGDLNLAMSDVKPTATEFLLAGSGIELPESGRPLGGRLTFNTEFGSTEFGDAITGHCEFSDLHWGDVETSSLLALDRISVTGIRIDPAPLAITVGSVEIVAPRADVVRQPDGSLVAGGFRFTAPSDAPSDSPSSGDERATPTDDLTDVLAAVPVEPDPANPAPAAAPMRFTLGEFLLSAMEISYDDRAVEPGSDASVIRLSIPEVRVASLSLPFEDGTPATGSVRLAIPGLVPSGTARGSLSREGSKLVIQGSFLGEGISTEAIAPYLEAADVELRFDDVSVASSIAGTFYDDGRASFELTEGTVTRAEAAIATVTHARSSVDTAQSNLSVDVAVSVADCVDTLQIVAEADWSRGTRGRVAITGSGIRGQAFDTVLPDGTRCILEDGVFELGARVAVDELDGAVDMDIAADGSARRITVDIETLGLSDGAVDAFRIESASLTAERIATDVCWIEALTLKGTRLAIHRTEDGSIEALGFRIAPSEPAADSEPDVSSEPSPPPEVATTPKTDGSETGSTQPAAGPRGETAVPSIRIGQLNLEIESLRYTDATLAEPIVVSTRIFNDSPWRVLEPNAEDITPIALRLEAAIDPFIETIALDLSVAPFAASPELRAELKSAGWSGSALTRVMPSLAAQYDAQDLDGASLSAKLWTAFELKRRSPLEVDLKRAFSLEGRLDDLVLRDAAGEPLAGVHAVDFSEVKLDLTRRRLRIGQLEVDTPIARVTRGSDRLHVAGFQILNPATTDSKESPSDEPASADAPTASDTTAPSDTPSPSEPPVVAGPAVATPPAFEITVGEFRVNGLDVRYVDETYPTPWVVPLDNLDLEVRNFAPGASNPRPTDITVRMRGAAFDKPVEGSEPKPTAVFSDLSVDARLTLGTVTAGRVRASLSGLDLVFFQQPAAAGGVTIDEGVVDVELDVKLRETGGVQNDGQIVLTDLAVQEGPDGPIRKYLGLPTPLQVAVFVVRDDDGSITLPAGLDIPGGGAPIPLSEITRAASKAIGSVIADAIASSPFRVTGSVASLVGLGNDTPAVLGDPIKVPFVAGAVLPQIDDAELKILLGEITDDVTVKVQLIHSIGHADIEVARLRANPPSDECIAFTERLRRRQRALLADRPTLVTAATDAVVAGLDRRAKIARTALREHDAELGTVTRAIDRWVTLATETSEHRTARRTRAAALQIAARRLELTAQRLTAAGVPEDRIKIRRPGYDDPIDQGEVRIERFRK